MFLSSVQTQVADALETTKEDVDLEHRLVNFMSLLFQRVDDSFTFLICTYVPVCKYISYDKCHEPGE